jgi:DNA-binding GntR family transcriptional regulator
VVDGLGAASLPSQIAELLEEAITSGELLPGQRLRGDDLASTYGVSRIPVREALRTLEAGGWVEIRPGTARTSAATPRRAGRAVRGPGDGRGVRRAARGGPPHPEELAELQQIVGRDPAAAAQGEVAELSPLSARFFVVAAHRRAQQRARGGAGRAGQAGPLLLRHRGRQLGRDWAAVHQQIVDAIADRDPDTAGALVREHIAHTGDAVSRLLALSEP